VPPLRENFFGTIQAESFDLAAPSRLGVLEAGVQDHVHDCKLERIKPVAIQSWDTR